MKLLRHWKMFLGLLAIFVAGMGAGGFLAITGVIKIVKHQAKPEVWLNARLAELNHRLKLAPDQEAKIRPILEGTVDRFHGIVNNGFNEFLQVIGETHDKVNAELTPDQQKEWAKMRNDAMKRWREFAREEVKKAPQKPL
jgi:hypothetical protein